MKATNSRPIIHGLFDSCAEMEQALRTLVAEGVSIDDISVLMTEDTHDRDFKILDRTRARDGAVLGGLVGGTIGGILGGVTSLGTAITGVGLVIVGPILAIAATGGLIGGFIGHGIPAAEANRLQHEIHEGKAMLAVHPRNPDQAALARRVLASTHGEELSFSARGLAQGDQGAP